MSGADKPLPQLREQPELRRERGDSGAQQRRGRWGAGACRHVGSIRHDRQAYPVCRTPTGRTGTGGIYYTTNRTTWTNIPGTLHSLVVGNFNGDAYDDLAGLTSTGKVFYFTSLNRWINIGTLSALIEH